MAHVHPDAVLTPTKADVARQWLEAADWITVDPDAVEVTPRFSYRFDDPAGKVGVEALVVRHGAQLIHLPLTYREAPLEGADAWLITTMEHSVLGPRWVYDGVGDPVLVQAFVAAILTAQDSVSLEIGTDDAPRSVDTLIQARGTGTGSAPTDLAVRDVDRSGSESTVHTTHGALRVAHLLDPSARPLGPALLGRGDGLGHDVVLAELATA